MKTSVFVTCLIIAIFGFTSDARACTCIVPPAPLAALAQSDAVFAGKVVRIQTVNGQYGRSLLVKFDVTTRWKGDFQDQVTIETADNSAACGYPFERGRNYIVYAHLGQNGLNTGICDRTNLLGNAAEDLTELGAGEEFVHSGGQCGGPTNVAALQVFLFLLIGIAFLHRRGRS